ncbi:hypothetical protein AB0E27_07890 [Streptomyces sparsogenes]|uniref:hypothetical protein n=1 Tax=Streptomyces sparsogenes TaxID=67365 RepID=UPI0033FE7BE3
MTRRWTNRGSSLEIYGHLRGQTPRPDKIYRAEPAQLIRGLGLPAQGLSPRSPRARAAARPPRPPRRRGAGES